MTTSYSYHLKWPDLFEGLSPEEIHIIESTLHSSRLEGFHHERHQVQALIAFHGGELTREETVQRYVSEGE